MPIYEYGCDTCGDQFETIRSITTRHGVTCVRCGNPATLRISAPVRVAEPDYYDDGLGTRITSSQQRLSLMRAAGVEETGTTHKSGARGTLFSLPGRVATAATPSGAYVKKGATHAT